MPISRNVRMTRSAISPRLAIRTFENTEVDCTRDPATPPRRSPRPPKKGYLLGGDKDHPGDAPNGIALSPDEKVLYVTAGFGKTMRYDVLPDDTVANGSLFIPAGNDGMKTDLKGNLYSTNAVVPGEVWITSKEGKHLGTIQMPQSTQIEPRPRIVPTNVAFGDADGKSLYITACTHLFRIRLKTAGILPGPKS